MRGIGLTGSPTRPTPVEKSYVEITPTNSTTIRTQGIGANGSASAGTHSTPAVGTTGFWGNVVSAGGAGVSASMNSNSTGYWLRGAAADEFAGFHFHASVRFPDASYNATGASTGSRINVGLISATAGVGTDRVTGAHAAVFNRCSVNGGAADTNWQFITSTAGGSSTVADTGIAFTIGHVYEMWIDCVAGGTTIVGQIRDITARTGAVVSSTATLPGATTALMPIVDVRSVDAVARNLQYGRIYVESDKG